MAVELETKHPSAGLAVEEEQPPPRRSSHLRYELFHELEHSRYLLIGVDEDTGAGRGVETSTTSLFFTAIDPQKQTTCRQH